MSEIQQSIRERIALIQSFGPVDEDPTAEARAEQRAEARYAEKEN